MKNNESSNNLDCTSAATSPQESRQIKQHCLKLLARREHSRKEMQVKLAAKGYLGSRVTGVIDSLMQEGWQDDQRYAENYARFRCQKGFGPARIAYELSRQGIDEETIEIALKQATDDWMAVLENVYARKYSTTNGIDSNERGQRTRFLQQRGFSSGMINNLFKLNPPKST